MIKMYVAYNELKTMNKTNNYSRTKYAKDF